jgi:hypothetical protein
MTRKILFAGLLVAGVLASGAPAMAGQDDGHLCVAATHDKNNPGPSVICVWLPGDAAGNR